MPALPEPESLIDLDDRERRVYGRFLRKVGEGPAAFFLDACRMMRATPRPVAASHLVGHGIREIESALRALLVPLAARSTTRENVRLRQIRTMLLAAGMDEFGTEAEWWFRVAEEKGGETQNEQIEAVLAEIGIADADPVAVTWRRLSGASRAHRPGLRIRPADQEFEQYWNDTVALFDALLDRLEHRYLDYYRMLDELLALQFPTREDVARLDERIPRNIATYKYFFERLKWPAWFHPLRKKRIFADPFVWYWPPAEYLTAVAEIFPTDVLKVMLGAETDSALTHAEFAKAALKLPATEATEWAKHETEWIGRHERIGWLPSEAFGKLVNRVASDNINVALSLTEAILADAKQDEEKHGISVIAETRAKVEWYELEIFLRNAVPSLAAHPTEALPRLVRLLSSILMRNDASEGWDTSHYWRPQVAQDKGLTPGRRNELVTAIRNIASSAVRSGCMTMPEVLAIMDSEHHAIFGRIARFLLAEHPDGQGERIAYELRDADLLSTDRGEHRLLARKGFAAIEPADQATLVASIERGPSADEFRERVQAIRGIAPTDDEVDAYVLRWQISAGEVIVDSRGETFRHAHDERRHALEAIEERRTVESVPLMTATELRALSSLEVVEYVQRFITAPSTYSRNPEELGLQLQQAVAADPEFFSTSAEAFSALPPSFVSRYLQGLVEATRTGRFVHWDHVLDLLDDTLRKSVEVAVGERQDMTWTWTRQHIAWLIAAVFEAKPVAFPASFALRMWNVIEELLITPLNDESLYEHDGETVADRALMRAMNSVRATAFDAAAQFVLWIRDHAPAEEQTYRESLFNITETLLRGASVTMHAAFGRAIGWLQDIDDRWLDSNIGRILPTSANTLASWEAAFAGIVDRWTPSTKLFELLRPSYAIAIQRIGSDAEFGRSHTADNVAQHLIIFYWRGDITIDDLLLEGFFAHAPGKLRGRAQWAIAIHLDAVAGEVDPVIQQRLDDLWSRRVAANATLDDRSEELTWFGFYYAAHNGDVLRATQTLKAVLEIGVSISNHRVVDKLARIAQQLPVLAFECYALLIRHEGRDRFLIYEERGRDILQVALDSEAASAARDLIHELASEGILAFRDLLYEPEERTEQEPRPDSPPKILNC